MFGTGIWRKEIHRRSGNLPQQEFDKILKSLEGKKLVKQVSSVQVCCSAFYACVHSECVLCEVRLSRYITDRYFTLQLVEFVLLLVS